MNRVIPSSSSHGLSFTHYFFVLLLLCTVGLKNGNAQNQLILRFAPLSLLDQYSPTFQTGLEYRFHKRFAFAIDNGIRTRTVWSNEKIQDKYFKIRGEFKVYWHLRTNRWYTSVSGFYMPESYDHKNGTIYHANEIYSYQQAHVRRDVSGGILKIGHVIGLSKYCSVDFFGGLGFRLIYSQHSHIMGLGPDNTDTGDYVTFIPPLPQYEYDSPEGQVTKLHAELGLKFNFLIFSGKK